VSLLADGLHDVFIVRDRRVWKNNVRRPNETGWSNKSDLVRDLSGQMKDARYFSEVN
jgi:hypothetical protein